MGSPRGRVRSPGDGEQHREMDPRPGKQEQPLPEGGDAWSGLETLGKAAWGVEHGANEEVRRLFGLLTVKLSPRNAAGHRGGVNLQLCEVPGHGWAGLR